MKHQKVTQNTATKSKTEEKIALAAAILTYVAIYMALAIIATAAMVTLYLLAKSIS